MLGKKPISHGGYSVYVSGTTKPIAVRVYNFEDVATVTKVISGIRYMSSIVVDDDILIVCAAGCKYGAIHLSTFGGDEVKAMTCIRAIIEAYPEIARMDAVYEAHARPIDTAGASSDVIVYLPAIRISSKNILADDEEGRSLIGDSEDDLENGERSARCPRPSREGVSSCLEMAFVGVMVMMIVGLMVACVVVYMVTDSPM